MIMWLIGGEATMPYRKGHLKYEKERAIFWRMLVECKLMACGALLDPEESFEAAGGGLFTGMVVGLGHLEGRPVNAAKIAAILRPPRPTITRKLKELERRKIVVRVGHGYILNEDQVSGRSNHLPSIIKAIERAYLDLAKIGAVDVTKTVKVPKPDTTSLAV